MINVFRSKEVYKNINTEFVDRAQFPMIPVRGIYVAGEWRPVFYADHMVYVEDISSTKARVITYTTKYDTLMIGGNGSKVNTLITNNAKTTITGMHNHQEDDWIKFLGFDYDKGSIDIIDFTTKTNSLEPDDWIKFLGFDYDKNDIYITDIHPIDSMQIDCMIRVNSVGGTKATISH